MDLRLPSEQSQKEETILRPDEGGFFLLGFITRTILSFIGVGLLYWGIIKIFYEVTFMMIFLFIAIMIALTALHYFVLHVRFNKEQYILHDDKIIHKGGGIFSEFEIELRIQNVTQVVMILPFIEHKLFQTGYIQVESAGSLATKVQLSSLKNTKIFYDKILDLLKSNGFKLERQEVVQEERPHSLAVFFEVFKNILIGVAFIVAYAADFLEESDMDFSTLMNDYGIFLVWGGILVGLGFLVFSFLNFMDLKRRVYTLYEDAICYTEGFLNKVYAVIPMENLSDSSVTQSFISKFFHLFDVKLSCQGSDQAILFKNILNGERLSENIDQLLAKSRAVFEKKDAAEATQRSAVDGPAPVKRTIEYDRSYTDEFRVKPWKVWLVTLLASPILLIIIPLGILVVIGNFIRIKCNVYRIKQDSIEHTFNFLNRKSTEFSVDKVTGIVFKESFVDKWCNSMQVLFWSIGSDQNVTFRDIEKSDEVQEKILAKKGIKPQKVLFSLDSYFNVGEVIKRHIYAHLFLIIPALIASVIFLDSFGWFTLPLIMVCYIATVLYRTLFYKKSSLTFYEDYIHLSRGIFFKHDYYVLYDDIKDITTVKYPLSKKGDIHFNIAGEIGVGQQQGGRGVTKSIKLTRRYVKDVAVLDELIDTIFYKRPSAEEIKELKETPVDTTHYNIVHSSRPAVINTVMGFVIVLGFLDAAILGGFYFVEGSVPISAILGVLIFTFIVFLLIVLPIKVTTYSIQPYRVLARSGIIFKKQISITFNKIDFINFSQGFANKIFGNGNITINTVGSSLPEITIKDIPDFKQFYEILKKNYK